MNLFGSVGLSDFGSHVWGMDTVGFSVSRLGLAFAFVFGFKVVRASFRDLKGTVLLRIHRVKHWGFVPRPPTQVPEASLLNPPTLVPTVLRWT